MTWRYFRLEGRKLRTNVNENGCRCLSIVSHPGCLGFSSHLNCSYWSIPTIATLAQVENGYTLLSQSRALHCLNREMLFLHSNGNAFFIYNLDKEMYKDWTPPLRSFKGRFLEGTEWTYSSQPPMCTLTGSAEEGDVHRAHGIHSWLR